MSKLHQGVYLDGGMTDLQALTGSTTGDNLAWWFSNYPPLSYADVNIFLWNATDTSTPDGTTIIQPTGVSGAGRWNKVTTLDFPQVNVDWNASSGGVEFIKNKPVLAAVATSGTYTDLSGRPTLATVAATGAYSDLSGKPTLATVATSGSYTDLSNKPSRSFTDPARSLNAAFQISASRDAWVSYSVQITLNAAALSQQNGSIYLEYADDSGFTTNIVQVALVTRQRSIAATALAETDATELGLAGMIPAAKYARLRTSVGLGSPAFAFGLAQEVLL